MLRYPGFQFSLAGTPLEEARQFLQEGTFDVVGVSPGRHVDGQECERNAVNEPEGEGLDGVGDLLVAHQAADEL